MRLLITHLMAFAIGVLGTLVYQAKAGPVAIAPMPNKSEALKKAVVMPVDVKLSKDLTPAPAPQASVFAPQIDSPKETVLSGAPIISSILIDAVAWYRNPEQYKDALKQQPFGSTLVTAYNAINQIAVPEVCTVKMAVVDRMQEGFTCQILKQEKLHVPEYTQLVKTAAFVSADAAEAVQQERLKDEAAIEGLVNPSFWQRVKWWWKS